MGYKLKRTLYQLTFEDPDLEGLEVVTKRISVDGLLKFVDLIDAVEGLDKDNFKPEDLKIVRDLLGRFAKVLVSWNVETEDDQPVPATAEGLMGLDFEFVMPLIEAWITGISQAPPPLPSASAGGDPPPEASLPMEALLPSPPS